MKPGSVLPTLEVRMCKLHVQGSESISFAHVYCCCWYCERMSRALRKKETPFDSKHTWLESTERKLLELQQSISSSSDAHSTLGELVQCVQCALLYICKQTDRLDESERSVLDSISVTEYENWMVHTE